jgi:hypothetical protein
MHVVVTVHGIRTYGDWQARLQTLLCNASSDIEVHSYVYGYFSILGFIIPPFRWLVTRRFRRELVRLCKDKPTARIDLIGHSFGTHLIAWGLRGIPKSQRPKIHTIILAASVLKSDFRWNELLANGTVKRVVNDCGIDDVVLICNQLGVLFTGMAGRVGFAGMTNQLFLNRYFKGGHSLFFYEGRAPSDEFMKRNWLPVILQDGSVAAWDERVHPSPIQGMANTIVRNAEPIKLAFYTLLLLTPAYYFYTLYSEAEVQRLAANQANVQLLETVQSLVNELLPSQGDYNSIASPWNEQNTKLLQEAIMRLTKSQVSTTMAVRIYVGRYCRDKGGTVLKGSKPLSECAILPARKEYLGFDQKYDELLGQQIARELKSKLMAVFPTVQLDMTIDALSHGKYPYPAQETSTIDDWNKIASLNTRVDLQMQPNKTLMDFLGVPGPPTNVRIE